MQNYIIIFQNKNQEQQKKKTITTRTFRSEPNLFVFVRFNIYIFGWLVFNERANIRLARMTLLPLFFRLK